MFTLTVYILKGSNLLVRPKKSMTVGMALAVAMAFVMKNSHSPRYNGHHLRIFTSRNSLFQLVDPGLDSLKAPVGVVLLLHFTCSSLSASS